jgi:lipopolysaccharide export system permease protein
MGDDLTVYIENRNSAGELEGLLIHDSRENLPTPVTIIAKRGLIVATEDGHQVLVYDGSRQDFNEKTGALNRLNFERYTIDLPEVGVIGKRWKQPDERTIFELLNPDMSSLEDVRYEDQIRAEIHKRLITPFLAINYTMMVLCCLLLGPINRRGQMKRILLAVSLVIMIQSLYLSLFSRVAESFFSLVLLYLVVFLPILISLFALSFYGEKLRRQLLYLKRQKDEEAEGAPS